VEKAGRNHVYVNAEGLTAGALDAQGNLASCNYLHGEGDETVAGCIVGHVARRVGVPDRILRNEENNTSSSLVDAIHADAEVGLEFTDTASHVLRMAQSAQDLGKTWGEALEAAKEYYLELKMSVFTQAEQIIMEKF
jgi:hypothetical protein